MAARRRPWLYRLRELVHDHGVRALWDQLYDDLLADGKHWRAAFPIARRRAELAVLLLLGLEQRDAAARLGRSLRTVASDAEALRRALLMAPRRTSDASTGRVPASPEELPLERRRSRR